jgi:class 3 adenylate cyclase
VLFADIQGSVELSRSVELEVWWSVMASVFAVSAEAVDRFGGRVDRFTGDGVMAVFDGWVDSMHHAHRACEAALWLRDALRASATEIEDSYGIEVSVRMGLNCGEILLGTIGEGRYRQYTATGYAVGLAQRMESLAAPGAICVTHRVADHVDGILSLRDRGEFIVKGAPGPVSVFELVGREES